MRFFFLLSIALLSCSNDPQAVKKFIDAGDLPIEKIEEAEMIHTENGVLKVKIIATTIKRFKDAHPELVFSNGVEVIFYNDSGVSRSVLKSESAGIDEVNNIMVASDNVVLTSSEGKKLETEELIWDEKINKIYTNKRVIITTETEVIEGEGFNSTPDFSQYSISKINGTFNFKTETD